MEDVNKGGQSDTDDLAGCIHYALQSLSTGCSAASVPHSDTAGEDALNGAPVEGAQDGR